MTATIDDKMLREINDNMFLSSDKMTSTFHGGDVKSIIKGRN